MNVQQTPTFYGRVSIRYLSGVAGSGREVEIEAIPRITYPALRGVQEEALIARG